MCYITLSRISSGMMTYMCILHKIFIKNFTYQHLLLGSHYKLGEKGKQRTVWLKWYIICSHFSMGVNRLQWRVLAQSIERSYLLSILSMKQDDTKIPKFIQGFMSPTVAKILKKGFRHIALIMINKIKTPMYCSQFFKVCKKDQIFLFP